MLSPAFAKAIRLGDCDGVDENVAVRGRIMQGVRDSFGHLVNILSHD